MGIVNRSFVNKTEGDQGPPSVTTKGSTIMTDDSEQKYDRRNHKQSLVVAIAFVILLVVGAFFSLSDHHNNTIHIDTRQQIATLTKLPSKQSSSASIVATPSHNVVSPSFSFSSSSYASRLKHPKVMQLQNCTLAPFKAPPNMDFKPIWMPAYPGSGAASASKKGDLLKPIVDALTGWDSASKNYHMSIKNRLKRCQAVYAPTAVCTNGHPLVPIGPQKQTQNFHHTAILVLRNFMTAYPAFMQDKATAYKKVKEQVSVDEWRTQRDQWAKSSFASWKEMITTWKEMKEYHIGLYIAYEELMDPDRGIAVVQRLAETLQHAGLTIAPADQIPCIWYKAVEPEYRRLLDFMKYDPSYTPDLKDFMSLEMEKFIQEVQGNHGDEELARILKGYLTEIRNNIVLDRT